MKNTLTKLWHGLAVTTALLSAAGLPAAAQAAVPVSPVGTTWDCVISGASQGVGFLSFSGDPSTSNATVSLVEIIVPKARNTSTDTSAIRGLPGNDDSRGGTPAGGGSVRPPFTNIFGMISFPRLDTTNFASGGNLIVDHTGVPAGQWGFDPSGRIVGFFTEVSGYDFCTTNVTAIASSISGGVTNLTYTTNVTCERLTNAISFTGKVVAGKRLTLTCSTPAGKSVYQGVPTTPLTDVSGAYNGLKKDQGLPSAEFFNLASVSFDNNMYSFQGAGPGYIYGSQASISNSFGAALVSSRKKIAFVADVYPGMDQNPNPPIRTVYGSVDFRRFKFTTKGLEEQGGAPENRISFTGQR